MTLAAWILLIVLLSFTGTAFLVWLWAKRTGQFEEIEEIKYRMLEEDEQS